ncbi:hypothetical protein TNCV_1716941 [Trichonephila clavipes]|nr:hypothetical protein TNCV_1716941 [Trichonephila clavipes]
MTTRRLLSRFQKGLYRLRLVPGGVPVLFPFSLPLVKMVANKPSLTTKGDFRSCPSHMGARVHVPSNQWTEEGWNMRNIWNRTVQMPEVNEDETRCLYGNATTTGRGLCLQKVVKASDENTTESA